MTGTGNSAERLAAALAGRYPLEREIGRGGMATVYLADDLERNRRVAIKVLRPELAAKALVVLAQTPGGGRTHRVDVTTGLVTELPTVTGGAHMSFSPGQTHAMDARNHRTLWSHPMDGGEPFQVWAVAEPDARIDYPVWSPDGRWVLFDHDAPRGGDVWQLELLAP